MARKRKEKIAQEVTRRKTNRRLKPMKIAALIVSAIQDLRETKGSTPNKIIGYISYASNMPESRVKRQVKGALKRGVEYGILQRYRGHYFLRAGDELDRANRIAVRFARLPTPVPMSVKSRSISIRKTTPGKNRRRPKGIGSKAGKNKRLRKVASLLLSPKTSTEERVEDDDTFANDDNSSAAK